MRNKIDLGKKDTKYLVFQGTESNRTYNTSSEEIKILYKNGAVKPMSESSNLGIQSKIEKKYYLCYPKGTQ